MHLSGNNCKLNWTVPFATYQSIHPDHLQKYLSYWTNIFTPGQLVCLFAKNEWYVSACGLQEVVLYFSNKVKCPHTLIALRSRWWKLFSEGTQWPVYKTVSCFFSLFVGVFMIFCLSSSTFITMQDLQTKRPIAVQSSISCFCHLDISSSLSGGHKTTTRSPVVTTGTDPDKSGTNLYRLSNLQKSTGRILHFF